MSEEPEEPPPLLRSWGRVYGAVVLWTVLVLAAIFVFSRWRF